MMLSKISHSLEDLQEVARWILDTIDEDVILLKGQMGAGKTTLIKAICKELEIEDEVSSPTYSLVNEYQSASGEIVYHFDLYRIDDESEALDMGIDEYLYSGSKCLIEWPEKISNLLPQDCATVEISVDGNDRHFVIKTATNE
ncbi:tRNA (adenosine(37)-N6)-threonylcarbamoyltransferase complex ATPase subunit type 1 TsaE [Owenweeksia hongkongensis]|uniref:tRNA (adenosine(37)-N6)-threonylcarbamoyltransferase complex ATPase subunit type 1 TsaE n=1 Tax=Owenweeksia hongkongensis TaxID=253245 RepID=UPI003A8E3B90